MLNQFREANFSRLIKYVFLWLKNITETVDYENFLRWTIVHGGRLDSRKDSWNNIMAINLCPN